MVEKIQEEFDKIISNKDKEVFLLKNHSQSLIAQIKKLKYEKKSQQEMLKKLIIKETMVNKETMTEIVMLRGLLRPP